MKMSTYFLAIKRILKNMKQNSKNILNLINILNPLDRNANSDGVEQAFNIIKKTSYKIKNT